VAQLVRGAGATAVEAAKATVAGVAVVMAVEAAVGITGSDPAALFPLPLPPRLLFLFAG
jgi:hypothetical protein